MASYDDTASKGRSRNRNPALADSNTSHLSLMCGPSSLLYLERLLPIFLPRRGGHLRSSEVIRALGRGEQAWDAQETG